jgi:N-acetylglucosaminyl-diphospho-decaprenol L-rhamnosyltransferase
MEKISNLSAVIVNYCTPDLTLKCIESLKQWDIAAHNDIIVVDNGSPDDSVSKLTREMNGGRLIDTGVNGGFSAGVNIGSKDATGKYLLVLNPDTYFEDDSIAKALSLLEGSANVGMVGLDLVYPDGTRQFSARRFYSVMDILARRLPFGNRWPLKARVAKHMMLTSWTAGTPFDADWVMGTGFIIRRELFEGLGRMDESYFLYMEDVDLCARVWAAGFRVVCIPGARLVHDHQRASAGGPFSNAGKRHLKSLSLFAKKYRIPFFTPPAREQILRG